MKKILFIIIAILIPTMSFSGDMCVRRDAVMVALDPLINGIAGNDWDMTGKTWDAVGKTWSSEFSYGILSGIAACSSETGGDQGRVANDQNLSAYSVGRSCYCKMLRPVESLWVYSASGSGYCNNDCARDCANIISYAINLRRGMFNSVHDL